MLRTVLALAAGLLALTTATAEAVNVRGSVEQVHVTDARPGAQIVVRRGGRRVRGARASRLGSALFRNLKPGRYRVNGRRVTVLPDRAKPPRRALYDQRIPTSGYGYFTTRDGTQLAINVRLPAGPPPYPTLVEYAGYGFANPAGAESGISQLANLLGFAVVDVNMRGTGCSGGAFDYFEPLQALDGYDVIETVARQPWVLHNKVGMVGISYGGISQLFVAARRPPSLAAITPLSVIDNSATTLYPGGILNTGFALEWAKDRVEDAKPAGPRSGQRWAHQRIQAGDETCERNQALHTEARDLVARIRANRYYNPRVADPLSPVTFVHKVKAPVFLACQWTDEQTGGHCPALVRRFTGTRRKWFTFTNGTHIDALQPATFTRWYDFLQIYVARRAPRLDPSIRALAPDIYRAVMGVDGLALPDDPIQAQPTYEAARAAFEAQPPVRVLFDNGAGAAPGQPVPGFERSFARVPAPGTRARSWHLRSGDDTFTWRRRGTSFSGDTGSGGLWTATPAYRWTAPAEGTALTATSAPLTATTTALGSGAVYIRIRSSARDVDLQATVTEVRPDGREVFVQSGWLRASLRALDRRRSTLLEPVLTLRRRDAEPLPKGRWARIAVPLYYQGHVYRAGSRIRVTISAPGGDQPIWAFAEARPGRRVSVSIRRGRLRLVLPVVDVDVPTGLPPCPGLRGEPCR